MTTTPIKAWHFVNNTLRDGTPIPPDGELLVFPGEIKLCRRGFHASLELTDALTWAPGSTICRVELSGEVLYGEDKVVASERKILYRVEGRDLLREFARWCALEVVGVWSPPPVVVEWLETGDPALKSAAESAAWSAARSAAWSVAESAAWSAARSAAWSVAESAAWSAARSAARSAAESAAWSAARSAAWSPARPAAWSAARSAAWSAARSAQEQRLVRMVEAASS